MRLTRLLAGLGLSLLALWVILGEHPTGASSDAVINVRLATVRAATEGVVDLRPLPMGASIAAGEALGTIEGDKADPGRLADLDRERADLMAEADQAEAASGDPAPRPSSAPFSARLASLEARIAAENVWLNLQRRSELRSNVNGLLWDLRVTDGETVLKGQDLALLADCDSAVVTLSVSESVYNRLRLGQPVLFRLDGLNEALPGTVLRLGGAGAASLYRSMAVAPSADHLARFDVMAEVPALRSNPELRCLIGRTGRVFFERRPLDVLRAWF